MANRIVLNEISYHGAGAIKEIPGEERRPEAVVTAAGRRFLWSRLFVDLYLLICYDIDVSAKVFCGIVLWSLTSLTNSVREPSF